ncbi:MAG TPA: Uma2 family endonuclease [Blastocatellia bacterium]|jgi:Uma2 family endonuclease|nr:Uma2 family endonuclease [Blastocatellia bacterium]
MALPQTLPSFTTEQYLTLERQSEVRHEYLDGFVYAMAGETPEHSTICFNLAGLVHSQLRNGPCRGFSPNMKVRTDPSGLFAYADLAVVCGKPIFHDDKRDVLINPTAIFEVLSASTEAYDRGEKFLRYRRGITTLTDYTLIHQSRAIVEHFTRSTDVVWPSKTIEGIDATLSIPSIGCEISLAEIYARVI